MKILKTINAIPNYYFKPKKFETLPFYESIGVRIFKKFLPTMGDYLIRITGYHCVEGKRDIKLMELISRLYELTHLVIFVIITISIISSIIALDLQNALMLFLLNIVVNLYPIMTQRYNRIRLYRIIRKMDRH